MALTKALKDALVADLETITTANGYDTEIGEVAREPKRFDDAISPGAYIMSGAYSTEPANNTVNTNLATIDFLVQLLIKSDTPQADMDSFFDDARNAIEKLGSSLLGVTGIVKIDVSDGTFTYTEEGIHERVYTKELTIRVEFQYSRGSA